MAKVPKIDDRKPWSTMEVFDLRHSLEQREHRTAGGGPLPISRRSYPEGEGWGSHRKGAKNLDAAVRPPQIRI
jgi:hypothetical protein